MAKSIFLIASTVVFLIAALRWRAIRLDRTANPYESWDGWPKSGGALDVKFLFSVGLILLAVSPFVRLVPGSVWILIAGFSILAGIVGLAVTCLYGLYQLFDNREIAAGIFFSFIWLLLVGLITAVSVSGYVQSQSPTFTLYKNEWHCSKTVTSGSGKHRHTYCAQYTR